MDTSKIRQHMAVVSNDGRQVGFVVRLEGSAGLKISRIKNGHGFEYVIPLAWVSGEISNCSRAPSGHLYFTLKDGQAQVDCVMFRSRAALLQAELRDGARVEARARVTLYEPRFARPLLEVAQLDHEIFIARR